MKKEGRGSGVYIGDDCRLKGILKTPLKKFNTPYAVGAGEISTDSNRLLRKCFSFGRSLFNTLINFRPY
jgi:hypothetical protein